MQKYDFDFTMWTEMFANQMLKIKVCLWSYYKNLCSQPTDKNIPLEVNNFGKQFLWILHFICFTAQCPQKIFTALYLKKWAKYWSEKWVSFTSNIQLNSRRRFTMRWWQDFSKIDASSLKVFCIQKIALIFTIKYACSHHKFQDKEFVLPFIRSLKYRVDSSLNKIKRYCRLKLESNHFISKVSPDAFKHSAELVGLLENYKW